MKYKYTLMKQDGEIEETGELDSRMDFKEIGKHLDCQLIEVIPKFYAIGDDKTNEKVVFYGDEEGRFNSNNHQNPHFASRKDERGTLWNVVGDILREEEVDA